MPLAAAGGDLTTTVVTAHTGIILVTAIGVIIIAITTINDDNGSGAYELPLPLPASGCRFISTRPSCAIPKLNVMTALTPAPSVRGTYQGERVSHAVIAL